MTVTALRASSPTQVLHQQVLVETCEQLALDPRDDLVVVLRDRLDDVSGIALDVHTVLLAAAWRDQDMLAGHISTVYERTHAAEQHDGTSGHDVCCGGDCTCAFGPRYERSRCDDCNTGPHALVDDAVRELLWFLTSTVGERAAREMAGAA